MSGENSIRRKISIPEQRILHPMQLLFAEAADWWHHPFVYLPENTGHSVPLASETFSRRLGIMSTCRSLNAISSSRSEQQPQGDNPIPIANRKDSGEFWWTWVDCLLLGKFLGFARSRALTASYNRPALWSRLHIPFVPMFVTQFSEYSFAYCSLICN